MWYYRSGVNVIEALASVDVTEITDITTAETDTAKHLSPDGNGGVEWADQQAGGHLILDDGTDLPVRTILNVRSGLKARDAAGPLGDNITFLELDDNSNYATTMYLINNL